ncbi:MAG: thymidine phosphorylase [Chthonomonadales bacterium]
MTPIDLIARKRDGGTYNRDEVRALVQAVVDGSMADDQIAAWLMAVYLRGMTREETLHLAVAMAEIGSSPSVKMRRPKLDKHSTGGVGDKTTLVVVPLLAACGVPILKMSGRALGYSGGTLDKLEAIPGFRVSLTLAEAWQQVDRVGAAIIGQSAELAPADKKLYAIRDVTATVDAVPLIASSIMSKKLAVGAEALVLDVKVGRGSFLKSLAKARELAELMVEIGNGAGMRTIAALTNMEEPLGLCVGNAVEVREACDLLTGRGSSDRRLRDLCVELVARGLFAAQNATSIEEARRRALDALASGAGAAKLQQIIEAQGGDPRVVENPSLLPQASARVRCMAPMSGTVEEIDAEAVGRLAVALGVGRTRKEDAVDPSAGVIFHRKVGDRVNAGEVLAEVLAPTEQSAGWAAEELSHMIEIGPEAPQPGPVIYEFVG